MRSHDVVVLLKMAAKGDVKWFMKDLSYELGISASEVSESINRSVIAGLVSPDKKRLMKLALLDFLIHGLRYVFPQKPGALVRGIPTAHSTAPLNRLIESSEDYVWAFSEGGTRGQSIEALHSNVPQAALRDSKLYELLALCDTLRVGKAREKDLAITELKRILDAEKH